MGQKIAVSLRRSIPAKSAVPEVKTTTSPVMAFVNKSGAMRCALCGSAVKFQRGQSATPGKREVPSRMICINRKCSASV